MAGSPDPSYGSSSPANMAQEPSSPASVSSLHLSTASPQCPDRVWGVQRREEEWTLQNTSSPCPLIKTLRDWRTLMNKNSNFLNMTFSTLESGLMRLNNIVNTCSHGTPYPFNIFFKKRRNKLLSVWILRIGAIILGWEVSLNVLPIKIWTKLCRKSLLPCTLFSYPASSGWTTLQGHNL